MNTSIRKTLFFLSIFVIAISIYDIIEDLKNQQSIVGESLCIFSMVLTILAVTRIKN